MVAIVCYSGIAPQLSRGFSTAPAESLDAGDAEELVVRVPLTTKPTWGPGVAPPGREQSVGELWAAMEHHGRGTRKASGVVPPPLCCTLQI